MSGAGSADSSGYSKFSYGENKMVRHALYSDIGTDDSESNTSDYAVAKTDAYVKTQFRTSYTNTQMQLAAHILQGT